MFPVLLKIAFGISGVLFFLYLFWKRLKEDYIPNQIFSTGFYVLIGISLAIFLANSLFPIWWFWLALLGGFIGAWIGILRFNLKKVETLEAGILSGLSILGLFFVYDFISTQNRFSLAESAFILALVVLFFVLERSYKGFSWYKSGRVGFSGFSVAGIFFLARSLVALLLPSMVSFVGKNEVIFSGILAFLSFLTLFNLSRQI